MGRLQVYDHHRVIRPWPTAPAGRDDGRPRVLYVAGVFPNTAGEYLLRALRHHANVDLLKVRSLPHQLAREGIRRLRHDRIRGHIPDLDLERALGPLAHDYDLIVVIEGGWSWVALNPPPGVASCLLVNDDVYRREAMRGICPGFGTIFVPEWKCVKAYRRWGFNVQWLPFAADPEIHRPMGDGGRFDFAFVGNIQPSVHDRRSRLLRELSRHFRVLATSAYGREMARAYSRANAGFNCGAFPGCSNMRVVEVLAHGRVLLTDGGVEGHRRLFGNSAAIVEYNESDFMESARRALDLAADPQVRLDARAAILRAHTYEHRAMRILSLTLGRGAVEPDRDALAA